MNFDTISIVGLGYIGLHTAAVFASRKKRVIGADILLLLVDHKAFKEVREQSNGQKSVIDTRRIWG